MMPLSTRGVLGHFYEPADALAAAVKVRDAGWKHFDFLTPFPIHGMEEAMGQKRSWIPWATGALALGGVLFAQGLQNYVMVWDWPMNFGGKPFAAWPAFIPITFEAMVFWAALGSALIAIIAGKKDTSRSRRRCSCRRARRSTGSCSGSPPPTPSGTPPRPSGSSGRWAPTESGSWIVEGGLTDEEEPPPTPMNNAE